MYFGLEKQYILEFFDKLVVGDGDGNAMLKKRGAKS